MEYSGKMARHRRIEVPAALAACVGLSLLLLGGCGSGDDVEDATAKPTANLVPAAAVESVAADSLTSVAGSETSQIPAENIEVAPEGGRDLAETAQVSVAGASSRATDQGAVETNGRFNLQLGSFKKSGNAEALAARIRELGYAPTIEEAYPGGVRHYRVFLRGLADRTAAERLDRELSSRLGITCLVLQGN